MIELDVDHAFASADELSKAWSHLMPLVRLNITAGTALRSSLRSSLRSYMGTALMSEMREHPFTFVSHRALLQGG